MTRILVIGAGFGGVAAANALLKAGFTDITLIEKADRPGGVWRDNRYPGCACDIPAPLYSYSYAPNAAWTRRFPPQPEILDYLERCVSAFGLTGRVRFGTEVSAADWTGSAWQVTLADGEILEADVLIPAVGQLSRPVIPRLPGTFGGPAMHTARWDASVPIEGRRVAVIGTGASVIQLVPAIAGRAAHVTVFQRSAPWTLPKPDRRYGRTRRRLYEMAPVLMAPSRAGTWLMTVVTGLAVTGNRAAGALLHGLSRAQRRWQVRDPELRRKVTPDEPMGCKRVLFTNAWYPALARPDVDLVTEKIVEVTENGIRTADGADHPCDVIVYGTGFAATDFLVPIRVTGRAGTSLDEAWRDGAHAYLGMAVPGFPNMFLVYGPNTNTGNTSVVFFHEAQARWIAQAVRRIARSRQPLEVRPEVAAAYDEEMQGRLAGSVWAACQSWYRTASGRIVTNWPGMAAEYRRRTARLNPADFR
ncbi:4-hydroxyacetophenone monooxygenase [Actinoplanes sp. SE50]|uniref:flavin-containing monooxygenase n=1 Tax=unclassified Actinoplanes TaxID=2626549 RepID=UPI00023EC4E1|nr:MULTISPECIES: NAD(P)/FAD-dependent oxidoreductase [unclassified Actinoplanes]AEV86411.1 tRNA uridine 5-carboxymethylaminomethyl modification enzyme mnmG [Actinoplanes sp. SE50/110]ATO84808.1 4-hydroxyacetophenone monooxygenase [Actinoplanes sp. SE50]SLM02218.1 4-hydroxyacetophenone monooxygenase [Actinoplanes sp. SE50/110]